MANTKPLAEQIVFASGNTVEELSGAAGASLVGFQQAGVNAVERTLADKVREWVSVKDFGAVGDGVADDTAVLQAAINAASPRTSVQLNGLTLRITATVLMASSHVTLENGEIFYDRPVTVESQHSAAIIPRDGCTLRNLRIRGAGLVGVAGNNITQAAVHSGSSSWLDAGGLQPAKNVTVENCEIFNFTAGVFVGASAGDTVASGWVIRNNHVHDMVGTTNNSEGYGILISPGHACIADGNLIENIKRHAIYLAGNAERCLVTNNIIRNVDNIAIHCYAYDTQAGNRHNKISGNIVSGITRHFTYAGAITAVGIFVGANSSNIEVSSNYIKDAAQTGIMISPYYNQQYGDGMSVRANYIVGTGFSDCGIRADVIKEIDISGNYIFTVPAAANRGITIGAVDASGVSTITANKIVQGYANSFAIVAPFNSSSGGKLHIYDNELVGFVLSRELSWGGTAALSTDTNGADLAGYTTADADIVHTPGGVNAVDRAVLRHNGTLTAARAVSLVVNTAKQKSFLLKRVGGGEFNLNVYSGVGGGLLTSLATNQWGMFHRNESGWELVAKGSL